MTDRSRRRGADRRRQRGGEDEARRIGAHRVAERRIRRDIAAETAEGLAERALDHVELGHDAVALGDAAAAPAIHADRMHFVEIGHGAVTFRRDAQISAIGRDIGVHRIDDSRTRSASAGRTGFAQQRFEMARDRYAGKSSSRSRTGGCPRSSNCGYRHPTGSGSSGSVWRWWRCRSRSRHSPR